MDIIQTNSRKQENRILKSNLWKFFKVLRAQANPIYNLLAATPVNYAWITIVDKLDSTSQKRINISLFINSLRKMPSKDKYYLLSINLFSHTSEKFRGVYTYNAVIRDDLSVDIIKKLWPDIIAYNCAEAVKRNERFELTPQIVRYYKFKARDLDELQRIIEQCNEILVKQ